MHALLLLVALALSVIGRKTVRASSRLLDCWGVSCSVRWVIKVRSPRGRWWGSRPRCLASPLSAGCRPLLWHRWRRWLRWSALRWCWWWRLSRGVPLCHGGIGIKVRRRTDPYDTGSMIIIALNQPVNRVLYLLSPLSPVHFLPNWAG